ncbi:MAG: hypothetical protein DRG63_04265 [Deltaproteobacteria bacterium]|nr:MAG: hypothetical protein DRG63_04265 [Deltaproteobacteria bacterium]
MKAPHAQYFHLEENMSLPIRQRSKVVLGRKYRFQMTKRTWGKLETRGRLIENAQRAHSPQLAAGRVN